MGRPRKIREEAPVKRPLGRPPCRVTAAMREEVQWLAAFGWTKTQCASVHGMSVPTFELRLGKEYEKGGLNKRREAEGFLVESARNGNVSAQKAVVALTARPPGETAGQSAETKKPRQMQLGKKEIAQIASETAGEGTEWEDDLKPGFAVN